MKNIRGVLFTLVLLLLLAPIQKVNAVENGGVGGKPANPRGDNPRSQSIFVYEVSGGDELKDAVLLTNSTDQAKTIKVYVTDSLVASGGAFSCEQAADPVNDAGTWITMSESTANLEPKSTAIVGFDIKIPENADPGEHNACIAIEAAGTDTSSKPGLALSFRSAIRVSFTVKGEIVKNLEISGLNHSISGDKLYLSELVKNTGNVSLDSQLRVSFDSLLSKEVIREGEFAVLRGQEATINFETKRPFWGGLYKVNASASYNNDTSKSLGKDTDKNVNLEKSMIIFLKPTKNGYFALLGIILLLAVKILLLYKFMTRRKFKKSSSLQYTVKHGDDIVSIGEKYNVKWNKIALVNKLKAPYKLEPGKKIIVPNINLKKDKIKAKG